MSRDLPDAHLTKRLQNLSTWSAAIVTTVGLIGVVGWLLNIDPLKALLPNLANMKFNTALAFVLMGVGVLRMKKQPLVAQYTASLSLILGLVTLSQYLFGWNLGIDQWLVRETGAVDTLYPGRMSPITTLDLILLSSAVLLMLRTKRYSLAHTLILMAAFVSMLAVIGYLYRVDSLYHIGSASAIAPQTTVTFILLCISLIFLNPTKGFSSFITASSASGYMVRRLLPAAIVAPILIGWLRWEGELLGLYNTSFGLALFTVSNIVISSGLILLIAPRLHSTDLERKRALNDLHQLNDELESVEGRTKALTVINEAMESYVIEAKNAEERFRALLESAPDAMIIMNTSGEMMLVNAQTLRVFGYDREELTGKKIDMLLPERFRSRSPVYIQSFLDETKYPDNGEATRGLELFGQRKDGSEFPVEISLSPIETRDGMLIVSAVRDVTERKRVENALRENEDKLQTIFQLLPIGASVLNAEKKIVQINLALEKIIGMSMDDLKQGRYKSRKYVHPDGSPVSPTDFPSERAFREEKAVTDVELGVIREDGTMIWTSVSAAPLPRNQGVIAVTADITRRKQIEETLKVRLEEEHAFQEGLKALHEITIELTQIQDLDEFYKHAVKCGLERLGFERLGLLLYDARRSLAIGTYGTDAQGHLIPEHHILFNPSSLTNILNRAMEKESRFALDEQADLFSNFQPIGKGWNAAAVLWNGSEKLGWLAADNGVRHEPINKALLDILGLYAMTLGTLLAQKRTEEALKESENQLSLMAETSPDFIFILDVASEKAVYVNRTSFLGYEEGDITPLLQVIHPEDGERVNVYWLSLLSGHPIPTSELVEFRLKDREGRWQWVEARQSPFALAPDGMVRQILVTLSVVTTRKEAEREAAKLDQERERVKMLSDFFRDTSHEFRTPLSILGTSLYLLSKASTPEQKTRSMERGEAQIKHMVRMLDRLQLMGRLDSQLELELQDTDLNQIITALLIQLEADAKAKSITLSSRLMDGQPKAPANWEELNLALLEIGQNAILFTPAQGSVTLRTNIENHHAVIEVSDTGIGIPEDEAPYIFDRLYRVDKARSAETGGLGVGLSIAKRIIDLHQGEIVVESVVGEGSTFRILLPLGPQAEPQIGD